MCILSYDNNFETDGVLNFDETYFSLNTYTSPRHDMIRYIVVIVDTHAKDEIMYTAILCLNNIIL